MDLSKYLGMFISESREHVQRMEDLALRLEQSPDDRPAVDDFFREAHSVKGMAASMGFQGLARVSHRMEDLLNYFRAGRALDGAAAELLLGGIDFLRRSVDAIDSGGTTDLEAPELVGRMEDYALGLEGARTPEKRRGAPVAPIVPAGGEEHLVSLVLDLEPDAPMPSVRAYVTLNRLAEVGQLVESNPTVEEIKAGQFGGTMTVVLRTRMNPGQVEALAAGLPDVSKVVGVAHDAPEAAEAAPRSPEPSPGAALSPRGGPVAPVAAPSRLRPVPPPEFRPAAPPPAGGGRTGVLRIEARMLDNLIAQVGELTMAKAALLHESRDVEAGPLRDAVHRLEALVSNLQEQALQLRMMPLALIADRFPRAVRDLAKQRGKEVQFEVMGTDIELDRAILELLPDPILHILRNAADHGIEPPDVRRSRGKPPTGRIRLEATREREGVVLRIVDDGRGMDPAALRAKGIALGLIRPDQAEALTDEEALLLVTLPGFSTAEGVSEVSGRGVGMDVVRSTIETLRGSLHIASVLGQGSVITLRLPLTLAIIDVLLVGVGEERYALPIGQVLQTVEFSERNVQRAQGQELIPWGSELIPLVRLRAALGAPPPADGNGGGATPPGREATGLAVVAEVRGRPVGMAVDRLFGYDDVVVKPLGKALRGIRGFTGVTILGDGEMVLILDPNTL